MQVLLRQVRQCTAGRLVVLVLVVAAVSGCVALAVPLLGCAAPGEPVVDARGDADLSASIAAEVSTHLKTDLDATAGIIAATVKDESARMTRVAQEAVSAVSTVDNSTSDDVVNRIAIVGLILVALTYPVGKVIWLVLAWLGSGRGVARGRARQV